jgi:hypothetical protein
LSETIVVLFISKKNYMIIFTLISFCVPLWHAIVHLQREISWMLLCGGDNTIGLNSENLYVSGQAEIQIPL